MAIARKRSTTTRKASMEVFEVKKKKKISTDLSIGSVLAFVLFGLLFGYFLSKSRATDFDSIVDMFMVKDFQLYGVIGTAILIVAAGLFLMGRFKRPTFSGKPLDWQPMKFDPKRLIGAFIFGAGWALAGSCPGTVVTQLGEGKVYALFTIVGILAGVWYYAKKNPKEVDGSQC